jgi:hypothetical protein
MTMLTELKQHVTQLIDDTFEETGKLVDGVDRRKKITEAWYNKHILSQLNRKKNARRRRAKAVVDGNCNLTIQYLQDLYDSQDGCCAITGLPIFFSRSSANKEVYLGTCSLDRIDGSVGYMKGNVRFVHKLVNILQGTYDDLDFFMICLLVADNVRDKVTKEQAQDWLVHNIYPFYKFITKV